MTEDELRQIEEKVIGKDRTLITYRESLEALAKEVLACWNAIADMRQDKDAYRRAIADVVRVLRGYNDALIAQDRGAVAELSAVQILANRIGDLGLTKDEFSLVWNGEASVRGVILDANNGACGKVYDADTGAEIHAVKRLCVEQGWVEAFDTDEKGNVSKPPTIRRHWRNIRWEPMK